MVTPQKMFKGFFYTLGTGYAVRLGSMGLTILIKRQLEPSVFADVFLGVTVFTMLSSLREFGLTHALLHFQDRVEEFVGTHFTLNVCITLLSCLFSSAVVLALTLLFPADFSWTFAQVAWVLAALHFVRQLALTSEALLRMDFEFGRLSLLHGLGTLLALSSALLAARAGWEEWSLILGGWTTYSVLSVVYVLFFSTATWFSRPLRRASLRFDWVWARRLLGYGVWIWIGWVLQIFIWWYDKLVVRLVVGDTALALYETAWWLVQIPTAVIAHIILNYSSALYSRYRHERERLGELFSKMISLVLRVSAPVSLILVFNAREITALLGDQWAASARIVVWLAAYALLRPLLSDGFGLLWAVGATRRSAYYSGDAGGSGSFCRPRAGHLVGHGGRGVQHGCGGWDGFCRPVRWPARLCKRQLVQGVGSAGRGIAGSRGMRMVVRPLGLGLCRGRFCLAERNYGVGVRGRSRDTRAPHHRRGASGTCDALCAGARQRNRNFAGRDPRERCRVEPVFCR